MATLKRKAPEDPKGAALTNTNFNAMDLTGVRPRNVDSDDASGTVLGEEAPVKRVRAEDGEEEEADEDLLEEVVETGDGGGKKEKAVKVKKIFLRILRKVMDVPQDSPLVRETSRLAPFMQPLSAECNTNTLAFLHCPPGPDGAHTEIMLSLSTLSSHTCTPVTFLVGSTTRYPFSSLGQVFSACGGG